MKVPLYVMGVYMGEIEVGENSIIGLLAKGQITQALIKTQQCQQEINQILSDAKPVEQDNTPADQGE